MSARPLIFGILNITPDSFSDGGKYFAADAAIAHGRKLAADGADVIDIGPASSHPDAAPVPAEEEIRRLAPVLEALAGDRIPVSVDSFRPETQAFALAPSFWAMTSVARVASSFNAGTFMVLMASVSASTLGWSASTSSTNFCSAG